MEVEVVERKENPLLYRDEIIIRVKKDVTPSRKEAKEIVVAQTGASPEQVIVKKIKGKSGRREFLIEAYVYKDLSVMKTLEPDYVLKRNGVIEDGEAQAQ